ncbi:MAG: hypothetical protein JRJ56_00810, partial [Deltaproteobacteria bacterium]|nr:hypothetical protein [Deltaproteobacteria bacterium]
MHHKLTGRNGRRTRPWPLLLLLLLLLGPAGSAAAAPPAAAAAAEADQPAPAAPRLQLEDVVVTATRVEEEVRDIPKNVTVITSEDIAQAPSNNIVD